MTRRVILVFVFALLTVMPALARSASDAGSVGSEAEAKAVSAVTTISDSAAAVPPDGRVVVYYFHRTARCENCLKFEAYAEEAILGAFSIELENGLLEWRVINLDDTTNTHFAEDYDLSGSSLVVRTFEKGEEARWRSLDGIWYFVDDKDRFLEYITAEVGVELSRLREDNALRRTPGEPGHNSRGSGKAGSKS